MDKLDEIRQRTEAATPGPWAVKVKGNAVESHQVMSSGNGPVCSAISPKTKNAQFIAHSREDIPYLLSEVDRLEKGWQEALALANTNARLFDEATARAEKAEAERDAAVQCIPHTCETCAHTDGLSKYALKRDIPEVCKGCCPDDDKWQLRGQEAGKGGPK